MGDESTTQPTLFSYQPPPGGDITLKSSDGVIFIAHSAFLTLASPVFAGMISNSETKKDMVELTEDAESVSLMLRFIYPPAFLGDSSLPLLKKSLIMAQKYIIEGIFTTVDYIISRSFDENSPTKVDPVEAFELAATYQLKAGQKAAARSVRLLEDDEDVVRFAKLLPSYSGIIGLLGAQSMRTKALVRVLANPEGLIATSSWEGGVYADSWDLMICEKCNDRLPDRIEPNSIYRPDWVYRWTVVALDELVNKPLAECEHIFHISILRELGDSYACRDCIEAARDAKNGECFKSWAQERKEEVKDAIAGVEYLYGL